MQATHLPTHASCSDESLATISAGWSHLFDLSVCAAARSLPAAALPASPTSKPRGYHLPRFQRQPR